MATVFCDNCGTSVDESAKFCRACGKATPLSELATKRFDQQPGFQNPTSPVGASPTTAPTAPAYYPPYEVASVQQTNDLRRKSRNRNLIIIASLFAVMIFALAGLLLFLNFEEDTPAIQPPPAVSFPPPDVPVPPVPPVPPPAPNIGGATRIDPSLIYPGSRQTLVTEQNDKSVLSLHSDDSSTKVADWYTARLKDAKKVSFFGQTVLKSGELAVVITGGDGGAEILITRGER